MMTLKVSSDTKVARLAGAIAGQLREGHVIQVQAIGAAAVNQTVKSLAMAESYMLNEDRAVVSRVRYIDAVIPGKTRTAMQWLVWGADAPRKGEL
jgi:stage V sporulation protein S